MVRKARIILLGAGGPAGANFIYALRQDPSAAEWEIEAVDSNAARLRALQMLHHRVRTHVMQGLDAKQLRELCDTKDPVLIHAQPDPLVRALIQHSPTYLPGANTIRVAQDKFTSANCWHSAGLSAGAPPCLVAGDLAFAEKIVGYPMWLRATRGAGARHATWAGDRKTAQAWIDYVAARFGETGLMAQPYLPGRDFGVTLLYWHGALVAALVRERIEYLYPQHAVSGRTGTPTAAVLFADEKTERIADQAARVLCTFAGEVPHGLFCVDLRETAEGRPVPTEVNAGRFFTTSHVGCNVDMNLVAAYAHLGLGGIEHRPWPRSTWPKRLDPQYDGTLVLRHMDMPTCWLLPAGQHYTVQHAVAAMRGETRRSPELR